jgi:hypothetical protein
MSGGFIRSSFYPFFPWQQGQQRKKTIKPQDGLTENQPIENNPELSFTLQKARSYQKLILTYESFYPNDKLAQEG